MNSIYFIDGKEYTWKEFIEFAASIDSNFQRKYIKTTSGAAEVLINRCFSIEIYKED